MGINFDKMLENFGIKDKFDRVATEAFEKAKETSDDSSIFESEEKFVEHYTNEMFGEDVENLPIDSFIKNAQNAGLLEDDDIYDFREIVDRDDNGNLSKAEAGRLLSSVYGAAQSNQTEQEGDITTDVSASESDSTPEELYEKVAIQPWGTGEDDCLSRVIQKHVDGIKLYSDDYNQYLDKMCELNGIEDPNIVSGEVRLPEMKRDENGEILRNANGEIQFYSEEELKEKKGIENQAKDGEVVHTNSDGSIVKNLVDANGNVLKSTHYASGEENAEVLSETEFIYENDKLIGHSTELAGGNIIKGKYDSEGRIIEDVTYNKDKEIQEVRNFTYNEDGSATRTDTRPDDYSAEFKLDAQGRKTEGTINFADGVVWNETYTYDENGNITKDIESSTGEKRTVVTDKNMIPISQEFLYPDGTNVVVNYENGTEKDATRILADDTKEVVYFQGSYKDYENYDAQGNLVESGKKDIFGKIKSFEDNSGGSLRTYEDGTVGTWNADGEIEKLEKKDENGNNQEIKGKDFIEWLDDDTYDSMVKTLLNSWFENKKPDATINEIIEKADELKYELAQAEISEL